MKNLAGRNEELLLMGAKATGSMTEGYLYVEESLYIREAAELYKFCQWVDKEVGGCGRANIQGLWQAFKHPDTPASQLYVQKVKAMIDRIKGN